ncbi:MAG: heparin lyase I family protein [Devosia sp.]
MSPATAAEDPITCVQTYLLQAGYAVGEADGKLGKSTIGLGSEFSSVYPELKLPKLNKANAEKWCGILKGEAGQSVLASRLIPVGAPGETVGPGGGLNFNNALVMENYEGFKKVWHDFDRSLWPGRVTIETDPARVHSGAASVRMVLLPGDCGWTTHRDAGEYNDCDHSNERVETNADAVRPGLMYYGFSVMIDPNFLDLVPFDIPWAKSEVNLYQWFQYDSGACFNLQFSTRYKRLDIDTRCASGKYSDVYSKVFLEDSRPGVWHEFVVEANWATDETGYFRVLQNGRMVMNYAGPTTVKAGADYIADHPQIYAYGSDENDTATRQYRTAATAWFDDMMRSTSLADIHSRYKFDDAALADFASAIPVTELDPALIGEPKLFAKGELGRLPLDAIGPQAKLPSDIVSGMKDPVRAGIDNAKAYGLARAVDPAGGPEPALRFEVRPGDCGREGNWDNCEHGQESVWTANSTIMKNGEHYSLAWRTYGAGPRWPYTSGQAVLMEIGQPVADDHLVVTSDGLAFQRANEQPKLLVPAGDLYNIWNSFVWEVVWAKGKEGRMTLTMNGTEVYSYEGPTLPEGQARVGFGLRRDGFKNTYSVVYFQHVALTKVGK